MEYGADVAYKMKGRSILEMAAERTAWHDNFAFGVNLNPYTDVKFFLMRHAAKMVYMNLGINEDDRRTIENHDLYRGYYEFCTEELEKMKEAKFYNDVSVVSVLMETDRIISRYARNEELVRALEGRDYDNEFPI